MASQLVDIQSVLSGGTDGPCNAAGAVVDGATIKELGNNGKNSMKSLSNFDSYYFFEGTRWHVVTEPTQTNVMDLIIILIH